MKPRQAELRRLLLEYVESANLHDAQRAAWVADHVVEYVDRLAGFARNTTIPLADLMVGDLIDTVEVGLEFLAGELKDSPPTEESKRAFTRLVGAKEALMSQPTLAGVETLATCSLTLQAALRGQSSSG